ncbi:hypothetical protein Daus18300_003638 [Diaporthe australafricana]|uniref:Uncharacterized protein n=1 Tax=Diaporthe australafricana TaxID=127596 RepID=A0ABR3XF60_9PEZI
MASQTPTGASQRLLTMKFMQRAAASNTSPTTSSTPTSDDGHASKRRKTSGQSSLGTPQTPSYVIDHKAAQAAREEEERTRQEHAAKQAEKLGDSHWALDVAKIPGPGQQGGKLLNVVQVGFSQIDSRGGGEDEQARMEDTTRDDGPSLRTYGPRKEEKSEDDSDSDSSDSGSSGSSSEDSDDEVAHQSGRVSYGSQKRQEIRSRQSAERQRVQKIAKERRKKEVKLNTLTSISGGSNNFGRRR